MRRGYAPETLKKLIYLCDSGMEFKGLAGIRFHLARRRAETFPEPRLLPWLYNFRLRLRPCHLLWREPPAGRHALLYVAAGRSLQPGSGRD